LDGFIKFSSLVFLFAADGKISRMTVMNSDEDELARSASFGSSDQGDGIATPITGYEMDPRVRWGAQLTLDFQII
jgi:hypothetical protein